MGREARNGRDKIQCAPLLPDLLCLLFTSSSSPFPHHNACTASAGFHESAIRHFPAASTSIPLALGLSVQKTPNGEIENHCKCLRGNHSNTIAMIASLLSTYGTGGTYLPSIQEGRVAPMDSSARLSVKCKKKCNPLPVLRLQPGL